MPTPYVKKLADKHGVPVDKAEDKWDKAKKDAQTQGQKDNYAYITKIFQNRMGEKGNMDTVDTVQMDVPFLIRIMELARETLKSDVELHVAVEKIIALSKEGILDMQAYEQMFGAGEESAALKEIALRIQAARKRIPAILRARASRSDRGHGTLSWKPRMIPLYRVKAATPILYHITSMRAVAFILTKDRFELKPSEGTSVEEQLSKAAYYLSCSRSKVGSYLLKNDYPGAATLVLDGTALGSRYHIQPVDYWDTLKNQPNDMMRKESYETEDRLMSPKPVIPSASKYITAIHIRKNRDVKASESKLLFAIKKACLLHKIPVYLYDAEDKQGFRLQDTRKAIPFPLVKPAQEIIEPMDDYHRKYFKDRFRVNSIRPWIELYYTPLLPAQEGERADNAAYRTSKLKLSDRAQQRFGSLGYSDAINSFEADLHNAKSIPYDHVSKEREELDRIVALMRKLKLTPKGFIQLLKDKWHPRVY